MTFNEFISNEDVVYLYDIVARSNVVKGQELKPITKMPYWFVKVESQELLKKNDFEKVLKRYFEFSEIKSKETDNHILTSIFFWILDELKSINELEKHLASEPDADMIRAGVETLNELGEYVTLRSIEGVNITNIDEVKWMPYEEIFEELFYSKEKSRIEKNIIENSKKK